MLRIQTVIFALFFCVACSQQGADSNLNQLQTSLSKNSEWPFETVGILDIVEVGGYDDSDYPAWAIGMLLATPDGANDISIEIERDVIADAKIDIDSGKTVRVWLGKPTLKYGEPFYTVEKIRAK